MHLYKKDSVFFQIHFDEPEVKYELKEYFSCFAPNYQWHPKFKAHQWDGKVSFFNYKENLLPIGLFPFFIQFCEALKYTYELVDDLDTIIEHVTDAELERFYQFLFHQSSLFPRDYQQTSISIAINKKRCCLELATGSGKSLVIYIIIRYLLKLKKQVLLVVPTVMLVDQMKQDFIDYGWKECNEFVEILYSNQKITNQKPVLISTWQSLVNREDNEFARFDGLMIDECLHPSTPIIMGDRSYKDIGEVQIGDEVLSYDKRQRSLVRQKVKRVFQNLSKVVDNVYEVELDNGMKIIGTGNHFVYTTNRMKRIDELTEKDDLVDMNNY